MQRFAEFDKTSDMGVGKAVRESAPGSPAFGHAETTDYLTSADHLSKSLRRVLEVPMSEVDSLLSELQTLRKTLQAAGNRIQRDIEEYVALSQHVMQLTTIISESVKKLPGAPNVSR
jgi:hypothetical protein